MRQIRTTFSGTTMLIAAMLLVGSASRAEAASIAFTFQITVDSVISGVPSAGILNLPTTAIGSASFNPFGSATYSEEGTVTMVMLPSGEFVPSQVLDTFLASFNGGADTITGMNSVIVGPPDAKGLPTVFASLTISGGTGIFNGATGSATGTGGVLPPLAGPGEPQGVTFSGTGQITAPGLNAVPEPGTFAFLGAGMAGMVVIALNRKRQHG